MSFDDGFERIGSDPFETAMEDRDVVRRLRGRLAGPVTVWTTYGDDNSAAGITVSSILIGEGEPGSVLGLIAPESDFWEALRTSRRFVVHVLSQSQARMADQFALRYPADPFEGLSVTWSDHGPVLGEVGTWSKSTLLGYSDAGYSLLVRGSLDEVELDPKPGGPLVHYRGRYFTTGISK